jgi:hypothetical protein
MPGRIRKSCNAYMSTKSHEKFLSDFKNIDILSSHEILGKNRNHPQNEVLPSDSDLTCK